MKGMEVSCSSKRIQITMIRILLHSPRFWAVVRAIISVLLFLAFMAAGAAMLVWCILEFAPAQGGIGR